jgi:hypothetical protein
MGRWIGAWRSRRSTRLMLRLVAVYCLVSCVLVSQAKAQETGASARLQQAQGQLQQLQQTREEQRDRRQRLLQEQKKLLDEQAQIRKEIPLLQKELKKPLSPEQRDRARCKLRDKNTQYDRERRRQTDIDQQLALIQQQSTQTQQQLAQTQQQVIQLTQEARQEQDAVARASDPLQRLMTAPATPLSGLPVVTVPAGKRLIILDVYMVFTSPGLTWTWDPSTMMLTADSGGLGGTYRNNIVFTMSDGSIQNVRARVWFDSVSPPGPALGLRVTRGPALMNAPIADLQSMFGPLTLWVWPAGYTINSHATIDVPEDPSIEPATFYITAK